MINHTINCTHNIQQEINKKITIHCDSFHLFNWMTDHMKEFNEIFSLFFSSFCLKLDICQFDWVH